MTNTYVSFKLGKRWVAPWSGRFNLKIFLMWGDYANYRVYVLYTANAYISLDLMNEWKGLQDYA